MKRNEIPKHIRIQVAAIAFYRCEYCLMPDKVSFFTFHIDHIRSIKHGGATQIENLAYCCPDCNYFKGSDIASYNSIDELQRFFNPRSDHWNDHFSLHNGMISGITEIGMITEHIFKFNDFERLLFRKQLIQLGQY